MLTGLSGCGKTSLLRLVCRLIPDFFEGRLSGRVAVLGRDCASYASGEISRHLGLLFQDPRGQFLSARVEDEIALTGENLGMGYDRLRQRVEEALDDAVLGRNDARAINYLPLPDAGFAVPTPDHYLPLLTVLGASQDEVPQVFNRKHTLGSIAMTSYAFGMEE